MLSLRACQQALEVTEQCVPKGHLLFLPQLLNIFRDEDLLPRHRWFRHQKCFHLHQDVRIRVLIKHVGCHRAFADQFISDSNINTLLPIRNAPLVAVRRADPTHEAEADGMLVFLTHHPREDLELRIPVGLDPLLIRFILFQHLRNRFGKHLLRLLNRHLRISLFLHLFVFFCRRREPSSCNLL